MLVSGTGTFSLSMMNMMITSIISIMNMMITFSMSMMRVLHLLWSSMAVRDLMNQSNLRTNK